MSVDLVGWRRAYAERCCQLAAAVLIVYEHGLQFDQEVELFWKKRWTPGKCLFIWSRYYSLGFIVGNATVFLNPHPTEEVSGNFFRWQDTGAAIQVITTHVILELRLYAMYRSNRFVVSLLLLLITFESVAMGVIFTRPSGYGVSNPAVGVFICADGDSPGQSWVVGYYSVILTTECTLLILSLCKAWTHRKTGMRMRGGVLYVLTRDSVYYFALLFWVYLGNLIIWIYNISTLNELATGLAFCLSTIFANRLMISLRRTYYHQSATAKTSATSTSGYNSISFATVTRPTSEGTLDMVINQGGLDSEVAAPHGEYEMVSFNERSGF